ncbi:MAG: glycerophosphodiester phosphodiesterase [Rhizobiaceae bacterium]|nr:glycerophosphodiester phosphodiesterase [Rhizobiaceae bacterium]
MFSSKVGWIAQRPIAHRAYHDEAAGIIENSRSAVIAAIDAGYNIEVDLQPSVDQVPMVFHDYTLERVTGVQGEIRDHTAAQLQEFKLKNTDDSIWPLAELLEVVSGKVGLVLELKGRAGADEGFIQSVAAALEGYEGDVAIMSFNHWLLADANKFAPHLTLGQTAEGDDKLYSLHEEARQAYNVDFVSYKFCDLDCRFVREVANSDMPVICWTIKSQEDADIAYSRTDQITFEKFVPKVPHGQARRT